jgi:hypothetical protein
LKAAKQRFERLRPPARDVAEDPVHEPAGVLGGQLLCRLHRLVDGCAGRRVGLMEQFEAGDPKDRPVERGHPVDRPLLRGAFQELVDLGPVRRNALHELAGEGVDRLAGELPLVPDAVGVRASHVRLVQDVEGLAPGLPPRGHGPHFTRSM